MYEVPTLYTYKSGFDFPNKLLVGNNSANAFVSRAKKSQNTNKFICDFNSFQLSALRLCNAFSIYNAKSNKKIVKKHKETYSLGMVTMVYGFVFI